MWGQLLVMWRDRVAVLVVWSLEFGVVGDGVIVAVIVVID